MLLFEICLQQARHAEEQRLELQRRPGVASQEVEWKGPGQAMHGIGIDRDAEAAGEVQPDRLFPVALQKAKVLGHFSGLAFETLRRRTIDYGPLRDRGHFAQGVFAGDAVAIRYQAMVASQKSGFDMPPDLEAGQARAVPSVHGPVLLPDDMKDRGLVGRVILMAVAVPLGGVEVHLDMAMPYRSVNTDTGAREIGPRVARVVPSLDHRDGLTGGAEQSLLAEPTGTPHEMEKGFLKHGQ